MRRLLSVGLILAGIVIAAGSAFAMSANEKTTNERPRGRITKVILQNDNGDIDVRAGDTTTVKRVERWNFSRPRYSQEVSDGTVTVRARCPKMMFFNNCSVALELTVPEGAEVQSTTTNGDVDVDGIAGRTVSATSTNGDLTFDDLGAETIRAHTTNGDVDISLLDKPDDLDVTSTNGDIDVAVPSGSYDIETNTTNGDVSLEGLADDAEAMRKLSATTTNGDITLSAN